MKVHHTPPYTDSPKTLPMAGADGASADLPLGAKAQHWTGAGPVLGLPPHMVP